MWDALAWQDTYEVPVVILATAILCCTAHNLLDIPFFKRWLARSGVAGERLEIRAALYFRGVGIVLLGFVPLGVALTLLDRPAVVFGLPWRNTGLSFVLGLAIGLAWLPVSSQIGRSPGLLAWYPEMRVSSWSTSLLLVNAGSWVAYLCAYEFLFRSFLLYPLLGAFGVWPAVLVSSAMYSISHFPKHPIERIAVTPGGVMFGALAVFTGSFVGPWVMHVLIAVSAELFAIRANHGMSWTRR